MLSTGRLTTVEITDFFDLFISCPRVYVHVRGHTWRSEVCFLFYCVGSRALIQAQIPSRAELSPQFKGF